MGVDSFVNHRLNNGSDAADLAINIAHEYARGKKNRLIAFKGSYHGQGHLPYKASHLQSHLSFFGKTDITFLEAPTHVEDLSKNKKLTRRDRSILKDLRELRKETFAVIIEPIQFNNNGNTPSYAFMAALRDECTRWDIPLIYDEVQTGWGWLGAMTAAEVYGIWPDIMAVSKSLTAGYGPLAAVVAQRRFSTSGAVGSRTNGADVRSLVGASAVMDRLLGISEVPQTIKKTALGRELEDGLLASFHLKHKALLRYIKWLRHEVNKKALVVKIGAIKGYGLARMIEIKNSNDEFDQELTKKLQLDLLMEGGVFVRTPSNQVEAHTLFIKMPIVASTEDLREGFERMREVMINFRSNS
jgi:4-aminobutyrate aminotransferase-like enzyme